MESIKTFCDSIRSDLRRTSPIRYISRRHIFNNAKRLLENFIQRALSDRRLFYDSSIQTTIDCLELEPTNAIECPIELPPGCDIIMKSIKKLPDLVSGGRGDSIIGVYTINGSQSIDRIDSASSATQQGRESFSSEKEPYYTIISNRLYLFNLYTEAVKVILVTVDTANAELSKCDSDCDNCTPKYDFNMVIPDKYKIDFTNLLKQSLLQDYMQIHSTRLEDIEKGK